MLDRFGARRVLPASVAVVAAGVALYAHAERHEALLLSQLTLALGFGIALAVRWVRYPAPVADVTEEGIVDFFGSIVRGIVKVAMVPHVWIASLQGAALFGILLWFGVVDGVLPWLGLGIGSIVAVKWSNAIRSRKVPILAGTAIQLGCVAGLSFLPGGSALRMALAVLLGVSSAVCVLSFSTVEDVVSPDHMGTSAAAVNGVMAVASGILFAQSGLQSAAPLLIALGAAVFLALVMKETYPPCPSSSPSSSS
jgi:hypothetical protein